MLEDNPDWIVDVVLLGATSSSKPLAVGSRGRVKFRLIVEYH